jgi:hypothetical protein
MACLVLLVGCGPKSYKHDADEKVYSFVDSRWEPEFGRQANYRITGATPSPNDIDIDQVEQIEKSVSDTGILTIPQAATIALARNRDYHLQKELLYTMTLDMRLIRHSYETQLFGGGTALYSNDGMKARVDGHVRRQCGSASAAGQRPTRRPRAVDPGGAQRLVPDPHPLPFPEADHRLRCRSLPRSIGAAGDGAECGPPCGGS